MTKKIFLTALCALALCPAFAQTSDTEEKVEYSTDKYKVETNRFWSNWFISLGAGGQVYFGDHDKQVDFGKRIAQLMLDEYKPGLAAHSITLNTTPEALAAIVAESTTRYGARELRRTIRKAVEDPISEALVDGRLGSQPATVTLTAKDGKPVLEL